MLQSSHQAEPETELGAGEQDVQIRSKVLSTLTASLVLFAPMHAVAQEANRNEGVQQRARPDYDPAGRRIGGFTLNAGLNLSVGTNDNVLAEEDPLALDDIAYGINPYGSLSSNWSRHALIVSAGADFSRFQDLGNEDTEAAYLGGYGRLDIGRDTNVSLNARLAEETEPRTAPDASGVAFPVEFSRRDLSIGAEHTINRFRFSGGVGTSELNYEGLQGFRDRTEDYVNGRVAVAVSPRLQVLADVRFDDRAHENQPALNSDGRVISAGVRMNLTGLLSGEVTVGQFERDYSGVKVDGTAYAGNVQWYVTPLTTLSFNGRRDVEETGAAGNATYIASDLNARVDHELRRNIILSAGIGRIQREYEAPTDREDEAMYADVGAEYLVNRRLALEVRYDRIDSESTGIDRDRDFEVNRFTAGVKLRL
jgi:hypothetical protein